MTTSAQELFFKPHNEVVNVSWTITPFNSVLELYTLHTFCLCIGYEHSEYIYYLQYLYTLLHIPLSKKSAIFIYLREKVKIWKIDYFSSILQQNVNILYYYVYICACISYTQLVDRPVQARVSYLQKVLYKTIFACVCKLLYIEDCTVRQILADLMRGIFREI